MQKSFGNAQFPHQKIRWNFGILCSETLENGTEGSNKVFKGLIIRMAIFKTLSNRHLLVQGQQWKQQYNVSIWNNKDVRATSLTLLPTLNRFHTLLWCSHYWLWASKYRLGRKMFVISWQSKCFKLFIDGPLNQMSLILDTFITFDMSLCRISSSSMFSYKFRFHFEFQ